MYSSNSSSTYTFRYSVGECWVSRCVHVMQFGEKNTLKKNGNAEVPNMEIRIVMMIPCDSKKAKNK